MTFTKGQQIDAGSFQISIGAFDTTDVAIISKSSGTFVKFSQLKKSKKLRLVKRLFKNHFCSQKDFCFSHFQDFQVVDLITVLRQR